LELCRKILDYPNYWFVGSESECSCTFRHLAFDDIIHDFNPPEDWRNEQKEEIDATQELYRTLDWLLSSGFKVDLVDMWVENQVEEIITINVSFNDVSENAFRLFEKYKFRLEKAQKQEFQKN